MAQTMRSILLAACLGLLVGCQTGKQNPVLSNLFGSPTYESFDGKFIQHADEKRVTKANLDFLPGKQPTAEQQTLAAEHDLLAQSPPLQNSEALSQYAEKTLAKLAAAWGGPTPALKVIVTTNPSYGAQSLPNGTIVLHEGVFVNADSEDELAFVLAHELSHILLNHSEAERHIKQRQQMVGLATVAALAATSQKGSANQGTTTTLLLGYLAVRKTDDNLLAPSWRREQEDEADLLGLDIAIKAGYSYAASFRTMQRLQDQQKKAAAEQALTASTFNQEVEQAMKDGQIDKSINLAFSRLTSAPASLLQEIGDRLQASHPDPEKREDNLRGYALREYAASFPPKLNKKDFNQVVYSGPALRALTHSVLSQWAESLIAEGRLDDADRILNLVLQGPRDGDPDIRIALYQLNLKRGRNKEALQHLEIAARDPRATEAVFVLLMEEYRQRDQMTKALAVTDTLMRRFGRDQYLPVRIRLLAEAGMIRDMQASLQQCLDTRKEALIAACRAASEAGRREATGVQSINATEPSSHGG